MCVIALYVCMYLYLFSLRYERYRKRARTEHVTAASKTTITRLPIEQMRIGTHTLFSDFDPPRTVCLS